MGPSRARASAARRSQQVAVSGARAKPPSSRVEVAELRKKMVEKKKVLNYGPYVGPHSTYKRREPTRPARTLTGAHASRSSVSTATVNFFSRFSPWPLDL
jgi:hypothetical protein